MVTDEHSLLVYSKEFKNNCCKCRCKLHCHCLLIKRITNDLFDGYMSNSLTNEKKSSME